MRIVQTPSPNFNDRIHPIDMLVLHYTGMETGEAALARMCDPSAEVSAHYMISEDGVIVQLVDEANRAWHAGVSSWQRDEDLNSRSIGIEIVNGGHDWPLEDRTLPPYPPVQISAVISLSKAILARHEIPASRIVGHSDIAPARKADPGEHFPWKTLAEAGIGLWPDPPPDGAPPPQAGYGIMPGETGAPVLRVQQQLASIGYALEETSTLDAQTLEVTTAFKRRWAPERLNGPLDVETMGKIASIARQCEPNG